MSNQGPYPGSQPPQSQPGGWPNQPQYPPAGQPQQNWTAPAQQPAGQPQQNWTAPAQQPSGQQWPPQQAPGWGQQPPPQAPPAWGQQPPPQPEWTPSSPPPSTKRSGNKVALGVVGGVLGVALIGGTVYALQNAGSATPRPGPSVTNAQPSVTTSGAAPTVATAKASDVVIAYLQALNNGDAATALSLAQTAPVLGGELLTDAVLAKSTAGRITDVAVPDVTDQQAVSVAASYALAGKPVSTTFRVVNVNGQFRLTEPAATVDLSRLEQPGVPVALAGVRPSASTVMLFPGVYPVTAANGYYSYGSAKVTVTEIGEQEARTAALALSSKGRSAIYRAVGTRFKWCLRQNSLLPAGCGFGVRDRAGVTLRKSTISWTKQSGAKWSKAKLRLLGGGVVEAASPARIRFDARDTRGRRWFLSGIRLTGFEARISGSRITVRFY